MTEIFDFDLIDTSSLVPRRLSTNEMIRMARNQHLIVRTSLNGILPEVASVKQWIARGFYWLNPSDVSIFRHYLPSSPMVVVVPEKRPMISYRIEFVSLDRSYRAESISKGDYQFEHSGQEYSLSLGKVSVDIRPFIPNTILTVMFQILVDRSVRSQDYLSLDTYAETEVDYWQWSMCQHHNMVLSFIENAPGIVAPGDGIGVCARLEKPGAYGDRVKSKWTHGNVRQENISDTLRRGSRDHVLVLSYISAFLSNDDWALVSEWKQVVFVDAKPPKLADWKWVSVNVWTKGVQGSLTTFRERAMVKPKAIDYSENLLGLKGPIYVNEVTPSVDYLLRMRKDMKFCCGQEIYEALSQRGVSFANTKPEWIITRDPVSDDFPFAQGARIYLEQIGKERVISDLPSPVGAKLCLKARHVYVTDAMWVKKFPKPWKVGPAPCQGKTFVEVFVETIQDIPYAMFTAVCTCGYEEVSRKELSKTCMVTRIVGKGKKKRLRAVQEPTDLDEAARKGIESVHEEFALKHRQDSASKRSFLYYPVEGSFLFMVETDDSRIMVLSDRSVYAIDKYFFIDGEFHVLGADGLKKERPPPDRNFFELCVLVKKKIRCSCCCS